MFDGYTLENREQIILNITYCSSVHRTNHRSHCRHHRPKTRWYIDL